MSKLWEYNSNGEFVVPNVRSLPQPIIHMLANCPQYFSICDNYLRGYSGYDYTRMFGEFDGPNFPKNNGRFLWIRDEKGLPWFVNNPLSQNAEAENIKYTMGLGYVKLNVFSRDAQLSVETTVFVPLGEMNEVWIIEIKNNSKRKRNIDFIPTVPIFGGSRAYSEYHRDVVRLYNKSKVTDHIEILPGLEWIEGKTDPSGICYFMSAETESGKKGDRFYSDRESFLGAEQSWMKPAAIINNEQPAFQCLGKEAVGAIEFKKVEIMPESSVRFVVSTGIGSDGNQAKSSILKYNYKGACQEFERLNEFWDERVSRVTIETTDIDLNILWNNWWCYQLSMRYWFGNTGHPQFDYGSDFAGWRDFWQDMMAATIIDPHGLEERTLRTLEGIRLDGTNATRFFARTKEFGSDETNGLWCDHPYWTTQTVLLLADFLGDSRFLFRGGIAYFKDCYRDRGESKDISWPTGDIQKQKIANGDVYTGTILEHLLAQLLTMYYDVGINNLLKQKRADWNDAVDQVRGENVTFSMGTAHDCNELADYLEKVSKIEGIREVEIFEELTQLIDKWDTEIKENISVKIKNDKLSKFLDLVNGNVSGKRSKIKVLDIVNDLRNKAETVIKTVNGIAWNGEYYTGYIHSDGKPVDSIFNKEGLKKDNPTTDDFVIMLMPQTWSLLSGAADKLGVTSNVLKSVNTLLKDDVVGGLKLNFPAYNKFDRKVGRITGFAPGTKENNAIFCHANLFMVWALLRRRRADEAYEIFKGVNPLNHKQEILRTGPWIPEYYISSDNTSWPGKGEYPLLTASAGWTRYIMQYYFFGVKGEINGLRIDPCLPAAPEFEKCAIALNFRGAYYKINFINTGLKKGTVPVSITVDGKKIEGNLLKPFSGGRHIIDVVMGYENEK